MANARRREDPLVPARESGYRPGGEIARSHANLASWVALPPTPAPSERTVRFLSVAGGYLALAAGYAGATLLILR